MKRLYKSDPNNWNSFENIANYHGLPNMCDLEWNNAYVPKKDRQPCVYGNCYGYGCCIHGYLLYLHIYLD